MYRGLSVIAMAPVLDEERKIGDVVRRTPRDVVDKLLVIDDGCTDRSPDVARELGADILDMGRTVGVGAALRAGYNLARLEGFDVAVVMAGNNKDTPEQIPALLDPIAELAGIRGLPVLHHIWQHRRREWPNQEISDGWMPQSSRKKILNQSAAVMT